MSESSYVIAHKHLAPVFALIENKVWATAPELTVFFPDSILFVGVSK